MMFAQLPNEIQKKVLHFLQADDFRAAKALCDEWHALDEPAQRFLDDEPALAMSMENLSIT